MTAGRRLALALLVVAIWAAITVWGGLLQSGQGSLGSLVSRQVTLATPLAALFLLVTAGYFNWKDLGFNRPRPANSPWLLWPVGVYIVVFAAFASLNHSFALPALVFILINTAFVGLSEELAFRGVLWGAARKALAFWPGVLLVSALFGSIHLLNVFITGELGDAASQALNAFLSGFAYLAMRIRTRSLWPVMIGHWLWDVSVFLSAADPGKAAAGGGHANPLLGAALVAPLALYGLWLLRKPEHRVMTDDFDPGWPNLPQR
jgi:membrane protease YdiL (CAAX protease family)